MVYMFNQSIWLLFLFYQATPLTCFLKLGFSLKKNTNKFSIRLSKLILKEHFQVEDNAIVNFIRLYFKTTTAVMRGQGCNNFPESGNIHYLF